MILADELNRASPKTQAALPEAMEKRQISIDGTTHELPDLFCHRDAESRRAGRGSFRLPEAQKDRFLINSSLGYPDAAEERELFVRRERCKQSTPTASQILAGKILRAVQDVAERVRVHHDLNRYIVDLIRATWDDGRVEVYISP